MPLLMGTAHAAAAVLLMGRRVPSLISVAVTPVVSPAPAVALAVTLAVAPGVGPASSSPPQATSSTALASASAPTSNHRCRAQNDITSPPGRPTAPAQPSLPYSTARAERLLTPSGCYELLMPLPSAALLDFGLLIGVRRGRRRRALLGGLKADVVAKELPLEGGRVGPRGLHVALQLVEAMIRGGSAHGR